MAAGPEVGGPIILAGATEMYIGITVSTNASANIAKGYNYGTKPNDGEGPKHGSDQHNEAIDNKVKEVKQDKNNTNIRKNQTQHDVNGNKVGNNRPDVQWDNKKTGKHHNHEIDTKKSSSEKHKKQIKKNDKKSKNTFEILPPSSFSPMPKG